MNYYNRHTYTDRKGTDLKRYKLTDENGNVSYYIIENAPTRVDIDGTKLEAKTFSDLDADIKASFDLVSTDVDAQRMRVKFIDFISGPHELPKIGMNSGDMYVTNTKYKIAYLWIGYQWAQIGNVPLDPSDPSGGIQTFQVAASDPSIESISGDKTTQAGINAEFVEEILKRAKFETQPTSADEGKALYLNANGNVVFENDRYEYTQSTESGTWTIVHNLGKIPHVTILDSSNHPVEVDSITHTNENETVITIIPAMAGRAILSL